MSSFSSSKGTPLVAPIGVKTGERSCGCADDDAAPSLAVAVVAVSAEVDDIFTIFTRDKKEKYSRTEK